MNRLGLDNLMADLTGDMALQLTSDYLIYRDEKGNTTCHVKPCSVHEDIVALNSNSTPGS